MIKHKGTRAMACYSLLHRKAFTIFSVVYFLFLIGANSAYPESGTPSKPVLQGHVDSLVMDDDKLIAQGWAGASNPGNKVISISIWLADTLVYEGDFEQFKRPDVVEAMGRNDWFKSGWRVSTVLPGNLKSGMYPVRVQARLDSGVSDTLFVGEPFYLSAHKSSKSTVRVILIALFALLSTVYFQADFIAEGLFRTTGYSFKPPVIFGFVLFLSFWVFIVLGITGSSIKLGLKQTPFVQSHVANIWGKDQPVRSDEWLVLTPLAIAQYNHRPKFPVVNQNLGEDGQNMLIVGMVGVPVAHISSIAKPAIWGFFLFDLKRALSWYWCFPIFACLFALWGVVALLLPEDWRSSFLIALWFSLSPYVAAWSHWPAYTVFFPSLALLSAIAILKSHSKYLLPVWSCILGMSLAGFILVLYPPWQISLAYLFLALAMGIVVRDKLYRNFNKTKWAFYGIAIVIAGLILWKWWSDAHQAIRFMLATVYPGQRSAEVGGSVTLPDLLRGFTNIVSLHPDDSDTVYDFQCGIASFPYMLLPLIFLFVYRGYQRAIGAVEIALALSISFILYFMLAGIPVEVAQFSLWGRVLPERADIALGLSNIILCGMLLSSSQKPIPNIIPIKTSAFVVALIWAIVVLNSISYLPKDIRFGLSPGVLVGLFIVVAVGGYWLSLGKFREFIYLNLALSAATIWPFNPVNIAPHSIKAKSSIIGHPETGWDHVANQRILVLETQIPAMYLLSIDLPVSNGVFYYPQHSLWDRLDKNHTESNTYNRYQHLFFSGGVVENADNYRIESPQDDVVKVVVDLERFDFRKTGARLITAPQSDECALRKNAVLVHIKNENGWSWFQITGDIDAY